MGALRDIMKLWHVLKAVSRPLCLPSGWPWRSQHYDHSLARHQRGRQVSWPTSPPPSSSDRSDHQTMSHTRTSPRSTRPKPASPVPGVSLSSDHIVEAQQKSTDNGVTLDLSYKNIRQISEEVAQELVALGRSTSKEDTSSPVFRWGFSDQIYVLPPQTLHRLALGFNRLTTLPTAFTLLTHVRYLNLKGNALTSIPEPVNLVFPYPPRIFYNFIVATGNSDASARGS